MWKFASAWLVGMCFALGAAAHAQLDSADPPAGSTLAALPMEVAITFTEDVEPRFSAIEVRDEKGDRIDSGDTRAVSARALSVALGHAGPGKYTVTWHVVAVDTHRSRGSYVFAVAP